MNFNICRLEIEALPKLPSPVCLMVIALTYLSPLAYRCKHQEETGVRKEEGGEEEGKGGGRGGGRGWGEEEKEKKQVLDNILPGDLLI